MTVIGWYAATIVATAKIFLSFCPPFVYLVTCVTWCRFWKFASVSIDFPAWPRKYARYYASSDAAMHVHLCLRPQPNPPACLSFGEDYRLKEPRFKKVPPRAGCRNDWTIIKPSSAWILLAPSHFSCSLSQRIRSMLHLLFSVQNHSMKTFSHFDVVHLLLFHHLFTTASRFWSWNALKMTSNAKMNWNKKPRMTSSNRKLCPSTSMVSMRVSAGDFGCSFSNEWALAINAVG